MDIGKRIKQLRVKNNLTLEELASRSELSKGFLSQLERNLTSPSITTLEDITEVLGISLHDFFKDEKEEPVIFKKRDYYVDQKDDQTIIWLVPMAQKNAMEPILYELEPGATTFSVKPYDGEEFAYVIKGRITIVNVTKREKHHLRKGETLYLKGNDEHYIINSTKDSASFIWICTPPIF